MLTEEQKKQYKEILLNGNIPLHAYYAKVLALKGWTKQKYGLLRFRKDILSCRDEKIIIHGVEITKENAEKIRAVDDIVGSLLDGYANLIFKIAKRASKFVLDGSMGLDDFQQELRLKAINVMYHYSRSEIKFITFLYKSLVHHTQRITRVNRQLSGCSPQAIDLHCRYQQIAKDGNLTFDEILEKMGIDGPDCRKQRLVLKSMLATASCHGKPSANNDIDKIVVGMRYDGMNEEFRVVGHKDGKFPVYLREAQPKFSLDELAQVGNLTDIEKTVLGICLEGKRAIEIENYINPRTNKPYTRMTATLALERIADKLKDFLSDWAA